MSSSTQNSFDRSAGAIDAEKTLQQIASLPAPDGLEDRVKAGLHAVPRRASLIQWPLSSAAGGRWVHSSAMRAAAAALIVSVVAGGAWGVYSHIRLAPLPTAAAVPQRVNGTGGFSSAGATRKPQNLDGPVLTNPVIEQQKSSEGVAASDTQPLGNRAHATKKRLPVQPIR